MRPDLRLALLSSSPSLSGATRSVSDVPFRGISAFALPLHHVAFARDLLVAVADDKRVPVTDFEPPAIMWNFSTAVDPLRGSWRIDEGDPRISSNRYDSVAPEQLKVQAHCSRTQAAITWSTGDSTTYAADVRPRDLSDDSSEVQLEPSDGNEMVYAGGVDYYSYNHWALLPDALYCTPGALHCIHVGSLVPGQAYGYRVGSARKDV